MKISVIGTGYLGAVHAVCMAAVGHDVIGVDSDVDKLADLRAGIAPFYEPGLQELLNEATATARLQFTASLAEAAQFADIHFICVGTPQKPGSDAADLSAVAAVIDGRGPHLTRDSLVVGKSTVPVGTAAWMRDRLHATAPAGKRVEVVWNPEFLAEGFAVRDTLRPDRIVVGTDSDAAEQALRELYAYALEDNVPWIRTDMPTAELVKLSANAFLATKISFINAMSEVCEAAGADVVTLATAIGHDQRIGSSFLRAGVGFGGGCLPKDIRAFTARAGELGIGSAVAFLREIDSINNRQRERVVDLARTVLGGRCGGRRVGVLGAAFKPNSDDVRNSPALDVAARLHRLGAAVRVHDPEAIDNARAAHPELGHCIDVTKACEDVDLVIHLTEWDAYRTIDPGELAEHVSSPILIDGRNAIDRRTWHSAGWTVFALGRPTVTTAVEGSHEPHD